jgi:dCMP deaminase
MERFEQKISTFIAMAMQLATLATCPKRQVGCLLLDKNLRVIGSGYNGVASGEPHCDGKTCTCLHAEINALDNASNDALETVEYVITTCAPCYACFKALHSYCKSIKTIYFSDVSKNSVSSATLEHVAPFTSHWSASKVGGGYQAAGTIISEFNTKAGDKRVVFEFNTYPGMLHIFTPRQVLGSRTKQLVPCFGTYSELSSKQVDQYNCNACQLKSACAKVGPSHEN